MLVCLCCCISAKFCYGAYNLASLDDGKVGFRVLDKVELGDIYINMPSTRYINHITSKTIVTMLI